MPTSHTSGKHFESFVQAQLASGRYNNASEVLRDALRLMKDCEGRLNVLDSAVTRGLADTEAGRVVDAETVFDRLENKYSHLEDDCRNS